jgi:hypothetical protein
MPGGTSSPDLTNTLVRNIYPSASQVALYASPSIQATVGIGFDGGVQLLLAAIGAEILEAAEAGSTRSLFHYANEEGLAGVLESEELKLSLWRLGAKEYLSDIVPGTRTPGQLAQLLSIQLAQLLSIRDTEGQDLLTFSRSTCQILMSFRDALECL